MGLDDEFRRSCLKAYATLDTDNGVAYVGITADGIAGANLLNLLDGLDTVVELFAVDSDDFALVEGNLQQGVFLGGDVLQVSIFRQTLSRVKEFTAADAGTPDAYIVRIFQFGEVGKESVLVQVVYLFLTCQLFVAG